MIPCPKCGGDTAVKETRGDRRRRWCRDLSCGGKLTTKEIPMVDLQMAKRLLGEDG